MLKKCPNQSHTLIRFREISAQPRKLNYADSLFQFKRGLIPPPDFVNKVWYFAIKSYEFFTKLYSTIKAILYKFVDNSWDKWFQMQIFL